jgi:hypothetical protein
VKMIQEQGGFTNFVEKAKHDMKELRDQLNAMLKDLSEIEYPKFLGRKT